MNGQTRAQSFVETCVNTAIGLGVSIVANQFILPHYGTNLTVQNNIEISVAYTFISIARGYAVRRWFEARIKRVIRAVLA